MPQPARPAASTVHRPVLLREVVQGLALAPGLTVVDGTVGGGGHSRVIWERIQPTGRLIGIDRDPTMLARARQVLPEPSEQLTLHAGSYIELPRILAELGVSRVDRILVDLGLSSDQLADRHRGFSFHADGPLDLRFDPSSSPTAAEFLATVSESDLITTLHDWGEEPQARAIAAAIVRQRATQPILLASDLGTLIARTVGGGSRDRHPATRTFQALRIAVNQELGHVRQAVEEVFPHCLTAGGLLAVITFHSLEDRLVKEAFRNAAVWETITAKPIGPTPAEERVNPRSRSAKLRIARRCGAESDSALRAESARQSLPTSD